MRSLLILSCFFLHVIAINAQSPHKTSFKRLAISFSPGTVPLPGNPLSLQPGIEFFFTPRISLLNEIGLQTMRNSDLDSTALNKRYFKYKAEARYYFFSNDKKGFNPYLGLQFTTANRKFDVGKTYRYYDTFQDDSVYSYSRASINSSVKTMVLQLGGTIRIFKNFYSELYIGYGARFVNTMYYSVENLQKIRNVGFFNIKPISSFRYIGKVTGTQLNLGFRISYRF
ncbi:MAG: hypothetical protein WBC06_10485 [Chitinophagaceae bacterium]